MSVPVFHAVPGTGDAILHDRAAGRWLGFRNPRRTVEAARPEEVVPALDAVQRAVEEEGCAAAGWVSYEAAPAFDRALPVRENDAFPLLWFGLYDSATVAELPPAEGQQDPPQWDADMSRGEYASAFRTIREAIRNGSTYQVNFTFRLRTAEVADPWQVFLRLIRAQGPSLGAFLRHPRWDICSASPELFLERTAGRLASEPMKGTRPRGLWTAEDLGAAAGLVASPKDRAENVMIVDMVRNDLGRIADPGSVRVEELFGLRRFPTVWQMVSRVSGRTGGSLPAVFRALFPPASITGAPKASTMDIIRRLEPTPRRIYTGTIGYLLPGGGMQFNVAIRTLLVDRLSGAGEYGVGSGVTWRSDDEAEYEECLTKARVLDMDVPSCALVETMRWDPGAGIALLDLHLERLSGSAGYFGRRCDLAGVRRRLDAVVAGLTVPSRVRLLLDEEGGLRVETGPVPSHEGPYRLRLAREPVQRGDRYLYHKTTHREVYERARTAAGDCDDVLLWNEGGELTETCIASLLLELDGEWVTPPVSAGLLPGVFRAHLLAAGRVRERVLRREDVHRATRVLLCNAVRGVWEAERPTLAD